MNQIGKQVFAFSILLTGAVTVMADTIDNSGQEPYEQCGYCHEYDGNSVMPNYPRLAGQTPEYLTKQLQDFRSGKRQGQMQATAELLSNSDIGVVARYFAAQTITSRFADPLALADAQRAKQLVFNGDSERDIPACISCHQDRVQGKAEYPRLAGQHAPYLQAQLSAFKAGVRRNDPGAVMRTISLQLSEEEIQLLSVYLAQFPGQQSSSSKHGEAGNDL